MVNRNNLSSNLKIAVVYSTQKNCIKLFNLFNNNCKLFPTKDADIILCLGGDGFMLHTLHSCIHFGKPIYGINCGNLGFLMNNFDILNTSIKQFLYNLENEVTNIKVYPLEINAIDAQGEKITSLAFNEASLLKNDGVAVHLKLSIDDKVKYHKLVGDGALVSTPFGSLAYNKACGGPVLPLNTNLLILTTINIFEPFHFKGAILSENTTVKFDVINAHERRVNLFCDFIKFKNITRVEIKKSKKFVKILFNKDNHLTEKFFNSQFLR